MNKEWKKIIDRKVIINNLQYGSYTLEIKQSTSEFENARREEVVLDAIKIRILPYWYQTWWFRAFICLASIFLIGWLLNQRFLRKLAAQKAEIEKQQALEYERERIARDMHDDLGSGISAIHLLSSFVKEKNNDPFIRSELEKITASSANLNQNIREIIWAINTADDTLQALSHFLQHYCNVFQENTGMQIKFEPPEIIPEIILRSELRRNLFLCIKEALNNAAKFATATKVTVTLKATKHQISITVLDNGTGFDVENAQNNSGNGLKNLQHRMSAIGGKSTIFSQHGMTQLHFEVLI